MAVGIGVGGKWESGGEVGWGGVGDFEKSSVVGD